MISEDSIKRIIADLERGPITQARFEAVLHGLRDFEPHIVDSTIRATRILAQFDNSAALCVLEHTTWILLAFRETKGSDIDELEQWYATVGRGKS